VIDAFENAYEVVEKVTDAFENAHEVIEKLTDSFASKSDLCETHLKATDNEWIVIYLNYNTQESL
jgi:hypothetical protein